MKNRNDGGAAFPQLSIESGERDGHGDMIEPFAASQGGMSLRDWYAGMALQGMIEVCRFERLDRIGFMPLAENAYAAADAMLKAREENNGQS